MQYGSMAPWRDMDAGKRTMMQRMSGRVSGLLDDLSDAISLLNDIMPSKASEQVPHYLPGKRTLCFFAIEWTMSCDYLRREHQERRLS